LEAMGVVYKVTSESMRKQWMVRAGSNK
jgi:hypothetical protein